MRAVEGDRRGSRSRPRNSPSRTARARRAWRRRAASEQGFRIDREQARGALEIALPDGVAGIALERRVEDARDLGPGLEPAGHRRAPAARARAGAAPWCAGRAGRGRRPPARGTWRRRRRCARRGLNQRSFAETRPSRRSEPPLRYLVPASMARSTPRSCGGKSRGVAQVLSMRTTAPRAVGDLGDRRDVLHLEGLRARRLGEDRRGVRPEQRRRCRRRSADRSRWSRRRSA